MKQHVWGKTCPTYCIHSQQDMDYIYDFGSGFHGRHVIRFGLTDSISFKLFSLLTYPSQQSRRIYAIYAWSSLLAMSYWSGGWKFYSSQFLEEWDPRLARFSQMGTSQHNWAFLEKGFKNRLVSLLGLLLTFNCKTQKSLIADIRTSVFIDLQWVDMSYSSTATTQNDFLRSVNQKNNWMKQMRFKKWISIFKPINGRPIFLFVTWSK